MWHSSTGKRPVKRLPRAGTSKTYLNCLPRFRRWSSNQWAHERHLGNSRQKAFIKVKGILYRLPLTKEASVFIYHNLNALVYLNIYVNQPIAPLNEARMKRQCWLFYNLQFPNEWKWILSTHIVTEVKWHLWLLMQRSTFLWIRTPVFNLPPFTWQY